MSRFDNIFIIQFWYIVMIAPLGMLLVWPFMWFFPGISAIKTVYCGLGVMVFTLYLAYGKRPRTRYCRIIRALFQIQRQSLVVDGINLSQTIIFSES